MAEEHAGLSLTLWAVIGALFVILLLLVDRWIHCTRNVTKCFRCKKDPPDPLAGVPDQPPVADESGFKRSHDREFERNWHMVALQRDMTEEDAQTILEARQKDLMRREFENVRNNLQIVRGVATVGGIQTE